VLEPAATCVEIEEELARLREVTRDEEQSKKETLRQDVGWVAARVGEWRRLGRLEGKRGGGGALHHTKKESRQTGHRKQERAHGGKQERAHGGKQG
jgi:hypothetical protein